MAEQTTTDFEGKQFGNYRLTRLLALGGFSKVFLGEQIYLKTLAAVKLLESRQVTETDLKRFLTETQILAHLDHPHIIRILEVGEQEGIPYIVMEYAPNGTLRDRHPRGSVVPLETIMPYVSQVANALQYMHDEKFIHRNVKPGAMLLSRNNDLLLGGFSYVQLIRTQATVLTDSSSGIEGMPIYMAPEQIEGKPVFASDQYALGAVVYEWLCGTPPFQGRNAVEVVIKHMTEPPPSMRDKVPLIPPAVERAVMKALAKKPGERFPDVAAFAQALAEGARPSQSTSQYNTPYISESNPTSSRLPPPPPYSSSPPYPSPSSQTSPNKEWPLRSSVPPGPSDTIHPLSPSAGELQLLAPNALDEKAPARRISRRGVFVGLLGLGTLAVVELIASGRVSQLFRLSFAGSTPAAGSQNAITYRGHIEPVISTAWSPDGKRIASASADTTVQVWDAATGSHLLTYPGHSAQVSAVAWSPNGARIASGSWDKTVQVWDVDRGNAFTYRGHSANVYTVAWSPDGKRIASAGADKTVQVWNAADGGNVLTYRGHSYDVNAVAWSPDSKRLASGSGDNTVQVWDAATGSNVFTYRGHSDSVNAVAWSPDSKRVASGSSDKTVQVWNAATGEPFFIYTGHTLAVHSVAWSPDGQEIASASSDGTVRVWKAP